MLAMSDGKSTWLRDYKMPEFPLLRPIAYGDQIALVYPGGTINAIYSVEDAKAALKRLMRPQVRFKRGAYDRIVALRRGLQMMGCNLYE